MEEEEDIIEDPPVLPPTRAPLPPVTLKALGLRRCERRPRLPPPPPLRRPIIEGDDDDRECPRGEG